MNFFNRLTMVGKVVIFTLFLAILGGAGFLFKDSAYVQSLFAVKKQVIVTEKKKAEVVKPTKSKTPVISIDTFVGWKPLIDASDKGDLGNVEVTIIDDPTVSSKALIKGDIVGAGYTLNRFAFLAKQFEDAGLEVVIPYVVVASNGADGIVGKKGISSIEDLVGKKIAVPRFSESYTLLAYLVENSGLNARDKKSIMKNLVYTNTPDESFALFQKGSVDVATTWSPYLSEAVASGNNLIFSTKSSNALIPDVLVFRKDWYNANKDKVENIIKSSIEAHKTNGRDTKGVSAKLGFEIGQSDLDDIRILGVSDNLKYLKENGIGYRTMNQMSDIWAEAGEEVSSADYNKYFTTEIMDRLVKDEEYKKVYTSTKTTPTIITNTLNLKFKVSTDEINDERATNVINKILDTVNTLDNTIVVITGYSSSDGNAVSNMKLSKLRADKIKAILIQSGVAPERLIAEGKGSYKLIRFANGQEDKESSRRIEVEYK